MDRLPNHRCHLPRPSLLYPVASATALFFAHRLFPADTLESRSISWIPRHFCNSSSDSTASICSRFLTCNSLRTPLDTNLCGQRMNVASLENNHTNVSFDMAVSVAGLCFRSTFLPGSKKLVHLRSLSKFASRHASRLVGNDLYLWTNTICLL